MKQTALILLLILVFGISPKVRADESEGKQFLTSVVYGTIAGTLVGAATLAFTADPGDNLGNIARGASLGLYAGILLGFYVTYVSGDNANADLKQAPSDEIPKDTTVTPDNSSSTKPLKPTQEPLYGFSVFPMVDRNQIGVGANLVRIHF